MAIISCNSKCEQIVTESTTICLDVSQYKQAHAQCPQVLLLFLGFAFPTPTDFLIFCFGTKQILKAGECRTLLKALKAGVLMAWK